MGVEVIPDIGRKWGRKETVNQEFKSAWVSWLVCLLLVLSIYLSIYIYMCVCVCMYIYIYTE